MKAILTRTISFILAAVLVIESFNISSVSVQAASSSVNFYIGWGKNYKTSSGQSYTYDWTTNSTVRERWEHTGTQYINSITFYGSQSGKSNEYLFDLNDTYLGYEVESIAIKFSRIDSWDFGVRVHNDNSMKTTYYDNKTKTTKNYVWNQYSSSFDPVKIYYNGKTHRKKTQIPNLFNFNDNTLVIYPDYNGYSGDKSKGEWSGEFDGC